MPQFASGKTVVFGNRYVDGTDEYGNDSYKTIEITVHGCAVSPGSSMQDRQGTEQITADITVHAPPGTNIQLPVDYMLIDDDKYNVVGNPNLWKSPFTNTTGFTEVRGVLVTTGGGAA